MTTRLKCSEKIDRCSDSLTLALAEKAAALTDAGADVVRFGTGEPDFDTPAYIGDGAKAAIDAGYTKYDAVAGVYALREAICDKLEGENHLHYTPANIVVTSGAKSALAVSLQTLLDPGDEVIIPRPYWVSYTEMVKLAGGVPVIVDTDPEDGFKMTAQALAAAVTGRTKVVMLNTPVNPTGQVYRKEELTALAEVIVAEDLVVISDEIYEAFVYDLNAAAVSIAALGEAIKARTIVVNGFSKTFAMTGWRLGWAAAPAWIAAGMNKIQGHTISHPSTISQHAGIAALRGRAGRIAPMIAEYAARRKTMTARLDALGLSYLPPDGTFYIFVDVRPLLADPSTPFETATAFSMQLLEAKQVVTIPGEAFGADGFVRFAYTVDRATIDKGFDRIEAFLNGFAAGR